jgi:hypothetical protein
MATVNHRQTFAEEELTQPFRLQGEAILRLAAHALPKVSEDGSQSLTGVASVDAVLRAHHVRVVEPVFPMTGREEAHGLARLYRLLTDGDEEVDALVVALHDHPDVEAIMPRYLVSTQ